MTTPKSDREAAKRFANNWSKPKPDTDAHAALVHAFERGCAHASADVAELVSEIEHAVKYLRASIPKHLVTEGVEPEVQMLLGFEQALTKFKTKSEG